MKYPVAALIFALLLMALPARASEENALPEIYAALSRIPEDEWQTIGYTDFISAMEATGETWPPEMAPDETQQNVWNSLWKPPFFSLELTQAGLNPYRITYIVEARREENFMLWVEGTFNTMEVASALSALAYEPLTEFPVEAYHATLNNAWLNKMPYVALPGRDMLLIASTQGNLETMLAIYDGHDSAVIQQNRLLRQLSEISEGVSSNVLRFDQPPAACPVSGSQVVSHGLRYNPETATWQYILSVAYEDTFTTTNAHYLTEQIEYSTMRPALYNGVAGQYTHVIDGRVHEGAGGNIFQLVMELRPSFELLPFDLASQQDACRIFSAPDAAAVSLGLYLMQDLGAARTDGTIRYGNVEQALYNAGLNSPVITPTQILSPAQEAALNNTWRTDLAFEHEFGLWFGFSPDDIRQVIEMSFSIGDYERLIHGDFETEEVEEALKRNGYIAVEQYRGTRMFILRDVPASGGFFLESLAKFAASPEDGLLVFSNNLVNIRLVMDVLAGEVRSTLPFARDLLLTTRILEDATSVIIHRYASPRTGGLICGLPPYRVEAFANVLRPDGWHFLYALGFPGTRADGEDVASALANTLEISDYPLQGPGSATIGELATVVNTRTISETEATVVMVDMLVESTDQQASFFGQDFAQANLPPCALGDINR